MSAEPRPAEIVEIERKFDVLDADRLPSFAALPGVAAVDDPVEYRLDAVYFDTPDLALAARRMALRRRTGGSDAGWHLKISAGVDAHREFHEPLGADALEVPERLKGLVRVHVRGRPLTPVARLRTRRSVSRLRDGSGAVLAEVSDDRVQADRLAEPRARTSWREWEVELVNGDRPLLDAAQALLETKGVRLAESSSKFAHALGERLPVPPPQLRADRRSSAGELLLAYLDEQIRMLWQQDPLVRQDEPDALHQMRVATRRARSALKSYRRLLDSKAGDRLRAELGWLAGILGTARDSQVLRERFERTAVEPAEDRGTALIDERLDAEYTAARAAALQALDSGRYLRLLDDLDALISRPPLAPAGLEPAIEIVPGLLGREWRRLHRAVARASRTHAGHRRDLMLHEARKAAKRVRYAAELAAPLNHEPALRLAAAAEEVQTILGDHQDGVVARRMLRDLGAQARSRGDDDDGYRRMSAKEQEAAADSEARFFRAWSTFPGPSLEL